MIQIDDTIKQLAIKVAEANLNYHLHNKERFYYNQMVLWQNAMNELCEQLALEHKINIEEIDFQINEEKEINEEINFDDELNKLKKMAIENYENDGGFMYETYSENDYIEEIKEHKTAIDAWVFHMRIIEAQKENCAYYDVE